jgi:hypothetical protein
MAQAKTNQKKKTNNGANVGYEAELWQMVDGLRDDKRWTVVYYAGLPRVEFD